MNGSKFLVVGENIHATRTFKVGGKNVVETKEGFVIPFSVGQEGRQLPIPSRFTNSDDWAAGKVKHCCVALWQGQYGDAGGRTAGRAYLQALAREQEAGGAVYLDVNVDEFSTDAEERARAMRWAVQTIQEATRVPVSVDSSHLDILRAGLEVCDRRRGRPMVNSVSLERKPAIELAREFDAVVIASAAGETGLPCTVEERMNNFRRLWNLLKEAGFADEAVFLDPLVLPISVDPGNGKSFLETVSQARKTYGPAVHIVAGLSNVSFGMPNRKLINQVFAWLAVEAGADGGIVDPSQINGKILASLDPQTEAFRLARDLLLGQDEFGMNFIAASREGRI